MTTNEILKRLYALYPSIGAWASSGQAHWTDAASAKAELSKYVGPDALEFVISSHDIRDQAAITFLRSPEAWKAICIVVDLIYNRQPLLEHGLLKQGDKP